MTDSETPRPANPWVAALWSVNGLVAAIAAALGALIALVNSFSGLAETVGLPLPASARIAFGLSILAASIVAYTRTRPAAANHEL